MNFSKMLFFSLFLGLSLLITSSHLVAAEPNFLYVKAKSLNVREKPSTDAKVVGSLSYMQRVRVVKKTWFGNWWQISSPIKGFVSGSYLVEEQEEIPEEQQEEESDAPRGKGHVLLIGGDLGIHIFSATDATRGDNDAYNDKGAVWFSTGYRLYGEWYLFGNMGIGALMNYQIAKRSYSDSGSREFEQQWTIGHYFATVNFVPTGVEKYVKLVLYGGLGTTILVYDETPSGSSSTERISELTSGTAVTGGICVDWGGDGFGMRAGAQLILTSYPQLEVAGEKYDVSASGTNLHLGLRWIF